MTALHDQIKLEQFAGLRVAQLAPITGMVTISSAAYIDLYKGSKAADQLALASDARIAELEFQLRQSWDVLHNVRDYTQTDMDVIIPEQMGAIEKTLKGQP